VYLQHGGVVYDQVIDALLTTLHVCYSLVRMELKVGKVKVKVKLAHI